jgi:hypothetical protein
MTSKSNPAPATKAAEPTAAQKRAIERAAKAEHAKRAKLAKAIAADKDAGMTGNQLREKYGDWLTGPARRKLFREHGVGTIAPSYDRAEAKAKREAEAQAREAQASKASKAKPAPSAK